MIFEDKAILTEFVVESNEHLADVEGLLLTIEASGRLIDTDAVNRVFRAVHSIKGAAGFLGLTKINDLAHRGENVLNQMRNRELAPNRQIVDLLLRSCDTLRTLINAIGSGRESEHDAIDIGPFICALDYLHEHGRCPDSHADSPTSPSVLPQTDAVPAVSPIDGVPPPAEATAADANIRVAVGVLDKLMNLAGELVLSRNQLLQAISANTPGVLETTSARIDQVTSELQEAIMQTRMQPLAHIFNRFPRVVRDLSAKLSKQCELVINGKEVEVDKSIIEAIGDPLIHLVRNSLDHGIEHPETRVSRGKKASGTITLEASHQAGRVNIVVRDDGAGIDAAKLRVKAVSKGIITAEQAATLSDRDAVELVFHPGFSTAEAVTDVSGRGVGMDVVKSNITRLGGTIDINTQVGRGTEVHVKLPLTLAIIPSLIVSCGGHRFAVSQANIHELVRVKGADIASRISSIKGKEVLRLRGKLLPLVRLHQVLGTDSTTTNRAIDVIVVETGSIRYGLVVDGLHDSEEIVVKPLGQHLKTCTCLAGATILGDGEVALILDVGGIATFAQLSKSAEDATEASREANVSELQATLMFTSHPAETFGIPMAVIRRLERIRADQIDIIAGQQMLRYDNASLPLITLEDHIRAKPRPEQSWLYAVIFAFNHQDVAVIVPNLNEICDLPTNIDTRTFREPGVIGSIVVDKCAIRLLDVFELAAKALPQLAQVPTTSVSKQSPQAYRILLAEDSGFFRAQVCAFLESKGYEVIGCEDGEDAWNTLHEADPPIDLVLTDIEMPNLNGFQLCERIRASEFEHLPVIALTSLAGEADVEHGRLVGIDDYQVKMDRDRLLSTVARLLKNTSPAQRAAVLV